MAREKNTNTEKSEKLVRSVYFEKSTSMKTDTWDIRTNNRNVHKIISKYHARNGTYIEKKTPNI